MLNQKKIKDRLVDFIQERFINDSKIEIDIDRSLIDQGVLDSFGIIEIVEFIESEYNCYIPEEDLIRQNFGSINLMANYLFNKLND